MRGYFGIGIDKVSKTGNVGNLVRTAHSFGANFVFAINPKIVAHTGEMITKDFTDTSKSHSQIPFFNYATAADVTMPQGCQMVGIELTDDAIDLPSFKHPLQAVYVLGGERATLSGETLARCDSVIKIPTRFSLNVATAGAIVMYDRHRVLGGYPDRPLMTGKRPDEKPKHVHGPARNRRQSKAERKADAQKRADGLRASQKDG